MGAVHDARTVALAWVLANVAGVTKKDIKKAKTSTKTKENIITITVEVKGVSYSFEYNSTSGTLTRT